MTLKKKLEDLFDQFKKLKADLDEMPGKYIGFSKNYSSYGASSLTPWRKKIREEIRKAEDPERELQIDFNEIPIVMKIQTWITKARDYKLEYEEQNHVRRTIEFGYFYMPNNIEQEMPAFGYGAFTRLPKNKCVLSMDYRHGGEGYEGITREIDTDLISMNLESDNGKVMNVICHLPQKGEKMSYGSYNEFDGSRIQAGKLVLLNRELGVMTDEHKMTILDQIRQRNGNYLMAFHKHSDFLYLGESTQSRFIEYGYPTVSVVDDIPVLMTSPEMNLYDIPFGEPSTIEQFYNIEKSETLNESEDERELRKAYYSAFAQIRREIEVVRWKFISNHDDFKRHVDISSVMVFIYVGKGNLSMMMTYIGHAICKAKHVLFLCKEGALPKDTEKKLLHYGATNRNEYSITFESLRRLDSSSIHDPIMNFIHAKIGKYFRELNYKY